MAMVSAERGRCSERKGRVAGVNFRLECERAGKCPVSAERGR